MSNPDTRSCRAGCHPGAAASEGWGLAPDRGLHLCPGLAASVMLDQVPSLLCTPRFPQGTGGG